MSLARAPGTWVLVTLVGLAACDSKPARAKRGAPTPRAGGPGVSPTAETDGEEAQDRETGGGAEPDERVPPRVEQAPPEEALARPDRRYDIESAIVHYEISGVHEGSEELAFTDFGAREALLSEFALREKPAEGKGVIHELRILDGLTLHRIDLDTKTGTTIVVPEDQSEELLLSKAAWGLGLDPRHMGGERLGTKTVAGVECELWRLEAAGVEACIVDGLTLEQIVRKGDEQRTQTATRVELGAVVPEQKLAIPDGVEMREIAADALAR
jgi:hypothetical protein